MNKLRTALIPQERYYERLLDEQNGRKIRVTHWQCKQFLVNRSQAQRYAQSCICCHAARCAAPRITQIVLNNFHRQSQIFFPAVIVSPNSLPCINELSFTNCKQKRSTSFEEGNVCAVHSGHFERQLAAGGLLEFVCVCGQHELFQCRLSSLAHT
jgi:hypothetical protein